MLWMYGWQDLLLACMCSVRERWVKDDSKVFDLSNWESEVALYKDEEGCERSRFMEEY